jgi:nicotinamide-nucleotide amidase
MNAIIISVGEELTSGQTINTNSAFLAKRLAERGIRTLEHCTVSDDRAATAEAIARAAASVEVVLVTGGLGPTEDDLTRHALADALGTELVIDPKRLSHLEEWFRSRGRAMVASNRVQAMVPRGAEALDNRMGTAPGLAATIKGAKVFVMPGVPNEMRVMYDEVIVPRLPQGAGAIAFKVVHTYGAGESDVGTKIADLMRRDTNPLVGTTVAAGMVSIRIQARDTDAERAAAAARQMADEVRRRLGDIVVGEDDETMAAVVGALLRKAGAKLTTAESCTGGLLGEMITAVSGSSDYYLGGVVAYANEVKQQFLDVGEALLREHGAVSEPVAAAMAEGCRKRFGSDWAIGVTGVAGPAGGTEEKPVGLVFVSLAGAGGTEVVRSQFPGSREIIRLRASLMGMNMLRKRLVAGR